MPVAQSVVGFVPDSVAQGLHTGHGFGKDVLELPLDPGKRAGHVRVRQADIEEVRLGPSSGGHTSLQLILKPEASYELVVSALTDAEVLKPIHDPAFWYGLGRLQWFAIYVGPIFRQQQPGGFRSVDAGKTQK